MADMTDSPYCQIIKMVSSPKIIPLIFREMVSSEAIVRGNDKSMMMTEIHDSERPLIQQIFGSNPEIMAESAKIIEKSHHPEGIDINMGCPVYKITSNFNGCALMKDSKNASNIVKEMKNAVKAPISVKIRAGWSDPLESIKFAPLMEKAGASLISIHGRTKKQGYSGKSDWEIIKQVKEAVSIPVLANGDIFTPEDVVKALEITKVDGVLIARGALGNPWIFSQINSILNGEKIHIPTQREKAQTILEHLDLHIQHYGERGVVTFRKHLTWYFKGIANAKIYRQRLHTISSRADLEEVLKEVTNGRSD